MTSQGVSQREIARRLNKPQSWVFRRLSEVAEADQVHLDVADIEAIAVALEVPVTRFLPAESPAGAP